MLKLCEKEKDRQKDILIAEIKAAGYGSMLTLIKISNLIIKDHMDNIRKTEQYQQQTQMQRESKAMI